jgi:hypothetical protein
LKIKASAKKRLHVHIAGTPKAIVTRHQIAARMKTAQSAVKNTAMSEALKSHTQASLIVRKMDIIISIYHLNLVVRFIAQTVTLVEGSLMTTNLTIEKLEALLSGITPGDWFFSARTLRSEILDENGEIEETPDVISYSVMHGTIDGADADKELIAMAPTIARQLVEVMREKEGLIKEINELTLKVNTLRQHNQRIGDRNWELEARRESIQDVYEEIVRLQSGDRSGVMRENELLKERLEATRERSLLGSEAITALVKLTGKSIHDSDQLYFAVQDLKTELEGMRNGK